MWFPRLSAAVRRFLEAVRGCRRTVVLLGANPFADGGGGKRPALLAREMLRREWAVLHLWCFPRTESVDLRLDPQEPRLLELDARRADYRRLLRLLDRPSVLLEVPHPNHARHARYLRSRGCRLIYDSIDAWHDSLGRGWYREELEDELAAEADVLVTTAAPLAERLERRLGRRAELLSNAVDTRLFDPGRAHPRPPALPPGRVALYAGALWGDWFDWELTRRLARDTTVVLLGDHRGECPDPPAGLHLLGLRPQAELPAFLAHSEVALIPWRLNPTSLATSPLKVYEYLAMRKPVVAPRLPALAQLPGVTCTGCADDFVAAVARAQGPIELPGDFLAGCSWERRLDRLEALW